MWILQTISNPSRRSSYQRDFLYKEIASGWLQVASRTTFGDWEIDPRPTEFFIPQLDEIKRKIWIYMLVTGDFTFRPYYPLEEADPIFSAEELAMILFSAEK